MLNYQILIIYSILFCSYSVQIPIEEVSFATYKESGFKLTNSKILINSTDIDTPNVFFTFFPTPILILKLYIIQIYNTVKFIHFDCNIKVWLMMMQIVCIQKFMMQKYNSQRKKWEVYSSGMMLRWFPIKLRNQLEFMFIFDLINLVKQPSKNQKCIDCGD
ncbi:unnamed protein product [Paramecium octaurelia]|uniref:Transmembrane protein n=1 Tax=Paramecium octaurelia TaxID=43137 RepID=A0A8S1ULL5_PAROT|nr:unnamed protein product [Paramecium octaurelia]